MFLSLQVDHPSLVVFLLISCSWGLLFCLPFCQRHVALGLGDSTTLGPLTIAQYCVSIAGHPPTTPCVHALFFSFSSSLIFFFFSVYISPPIPESLGTLVLAMPLPPSPLKLSHRRPSDMDDSPVSPGTMGANAYAPQSPRSPRTPRLSAPPSPVASRQNENNMNGSHRESVDLSAEPGTGGGGGLGSLADELADAWEQEEEGYGYASGQESARAGSQQMDQSDGEDAYMQSVRNMRPGSPPTDSPARNRLRAPHLRQHRRQGSHYDGSDYGNDSDLDETADIPPALDSQMADIESLARRGIENNGSESDHVIQRTVEALRDLGGQSGIENSAMR